MIVWGFVFMYIAAGAALWPPIFKWFVNDMKYSGDPRPDVGTVIGAALIAMFICIVWPVVALYRFIMKPVARWWIEAEYPQKPVEDRDMYGRPRR